MKNLVPPVAQRKRKITSLSSAIQGFDSLPSYIAPVCDVSSISKQDLIKAMSGKANTAERKFSCSKERLMQALFPIVDNQRELYDALKKN